MSPRVQEALDFLAGLNPSKMKFGLEPVQKALEALGRPHERIPTLHVAGTNGKGSTCAFLHSVLHEAGFRVGLYTSPHLIHVNERFRLGAELISDERLAECVEDVLARHPDSRALTYFEFCTVLAFVYFEAEKVDALVLETGLGGRLDATNCCSPVLTAVTSISRDHTQYLGETLPEIAREKGGIFKPGRAAIVARQSPQVMQTLEACALAAGARFQPMGGNVRGWATSNDLMHFESPRVRWTQLKLGLQGPHQIQNAEVALGCIDELRLQGWVIDESAVRSGLERVTWPGRFEVLEGQPTVILDGAHNLDGVKALKRALLQRFSDARVHLVFGVLSDKDYLPMAMELFPIAQSVHVTPVDSPRAVPVETLSQQVKGLARKLLAHSSFEQALTSAIHCCQEGERVLVCGSLVLIGQAKRAMSPKGILGALRHTS